MNVQRRFRSWRAWMRLRRTTKKLNGSFNAFGLSVQEAEEGMKRLRGALERAAEEETRAYIDAALRAVGL